MRATSWLVGWATDTVAEIPDGLGYETYQNDEGETRYQAYKISDDNKNRDHALRRIRKLIEEQTNFRNWV